MLIVVCCGFIETGCYGRLINKLPWSTRAASATLEFLLKYKILIKYIRVIKMAATDKQDGMVTALPHAADIRNAHGKENERFDPGGIFGNAPGIKNTFEINIIAG